MRYTVLGEATDPGAEGHNARNCVSEQKADVVIGGASTPVSAAFAAVAAETGLISRLIR